ncbi:MAG: TIM44-like domain-containing protein [Alphaproteobacteria bacterium]|uniref:TIM44-like domain-containing protein n=1 Tax=Candidatus Nitrobium versatile TaxID=2884831 RepID=A0A953JF66_9BACT|nr:TIM44-like domain-containing protein [Candidatus Nitrobium versatile]
MNLKRIVLLFTITLFFAAAVEESAFARAGRSGSTGGSTLGSRGSRIYSAPERAPSSSQNQYQNQYQSQQRSTLPSPAPSSTGGFFRSLAGGLAGGFLGALLFRSLGFGGYGSGFGGGIGILEILLIGLIIFVIYKIVQSKRRPAYEGAFQGRHPEHAFRYQPAEEIPVRKIPVPDAPAASPYGSNREAGISSVRQFDPGFDESRFREQGKDFLTVALTANVLDYVTDEAGRLVEESRTEPVKFKEYWTFVRSTGTSAWQLSAIQQGE